MDIVAGENLFGPEGIRKMLKDHICYPQNRASFYKGKFKYKNKISFTCVEGHLLPCYFAFYRGFYTCIVEKKQRGMKNGQNAYSRELALFYSHFHVDCEIPFFNICE